MNRIRKSSGSRSLAARIALSAVLVLMLVLAPAVIAFSHGPGAIQMVQQPEIVDPGHGHFHSGGDAGAGQHDATDHEHQVAAILAGAGRPGFELRRSGLLPEVHSAGGRSLDGPRRPPRDVMI